MTRQALALFGAALATAALATACPGPQRLVGTPSTPAASVPTATPTLDPTVAAAASTLGAVHTPTGRVCLEVDVVGQTLEIGDDDFALVDGSMGRTIDFARQDDVSSATMTFLHEVHAFTHVIDVPLREKETPLGERLWNSVYELEAAMAQGTDGPAMADRATAIRELLREAARALGCTE
jgi:hypothetical protein